MDSRLLAYLKLQEPTDEEVVELLYALILRRAPEDEARERCLAKLAEGTLSVATLVHELAGATEFERVRLLDDAIALAAGARARGERPRLLTAPTGTDERLIEIPWVLSRVPLDGPVLEVGYAFAEPSYLAALIAACRGRLTGVDLAVAEVPGLEAIEADVRSLPFADGSFRTILLVSTLEHVGADNAQYGHAGSTDEGARVDALRELRRVLAPAGRLLVTVPTGEPGDHGWFRQEDVAGWTKLFAKAGLFVEEQEVYELGEGGWCAAPAFDAEGVHYGERGPAASAVLCAELSSRSLPSRLSPDAITRTARRKGAPFWRRLRPRV